MPDNEQAELSEIIGDFLATTSYDEEPTPEEYFRELKEWAEEDD